MFRATLFRVKICFKILHLFFENETNLGHNMLHVMSANFFLLDNRLYYRYWKLSWEATASFWISIVAISWCRIVIAYLTNHPLYCFDYSTVYMYSCIQLSSIRISHIRLLQCTLAAWIWFTDSFKGQVPATAQSVRRKNRVRDRVGKC